MFVLQRRRGTRPDQSANFGIFNEIRRRSCSQDYFGSLRARDGETLNVIHPHRLQKLEGWRVFDPLCNTLHAEIAR